MQEEQQQQEPSSQESQGSRKATHGARLHPRYQMNPGTSGSWGRKDKRDGEDIATRKGTPTRVVPSERRRRYGHHRTERNEASGKTAETLSPCRCLVTYLDYLTQEVNFNGNGQRFIFLLKSSALRQPPSTDSAVKLQEVKELHFTIYTEDVTLWTS